MKLSEIPNAAFSAPVTDIPTKIIQVPDWQKLYETLKKSGFILISCPTDEIRLTKHGAEECPTAKAFNSWYRANFSQQLKTRRISKNLWFITL